MHNLPTTLKRPLSRRLMPLVYGLVAVVGLILVLTWVSLQVQVALAGLLNGESIWSKAQKQVVVDLNAYAAKGAPQELAKYRRNYDILMADHNAREAILSGAYDYQAVEQMLQKSHTVAISIPGVIFLLHHFSDAPYMREALSAWRSTDSSIAEINVIADELKRGYSEGGIEQREIELQQARINAINDYIEPRSKQFSLQIAQGAAWVGQVLFFSVSGAAILAALLWLRMAKRILASIRGTEERYSLLFDSAADAIVMVDENNGRIIDVNRTAAAWTGRSVEDLVGDRFVHLFTQSVSQRLDRAATNALLDVDGSARPVETQSSLVVWGERTVRQAIIRDISERVALEQERRVAAEALASIAEGVIIADADRRVISVNAAHEEITGFSLRDLQERRFDATRSLPDGTPLPQAIWDSIAAGRNWIGEVQSARRDGNRYPEQLSISALRDADNQVLYYVAVFTNIFASKANQRRLEFMARHDPLTGLVNRSEFERLCAEAVATAAREKMAAAVLFIDLDAFKVVNDSYSHAVGDRLLVKVAERINRQLDDTDLAGRIGGDEFTVLISRLGLREDAGAVATRLLASMAEPFVIDDYEIVLSASIGIAGYPLDGEDAVTLIANADAAMYTAKTEERNTIRFYSPLMHVHASRRLQLVAELRQALVNDEFRLVYQPSIELSTGRIVAVEALLRWRHPERGDVMPAEFIPVAESLGLIRRIDEWVMQTACAQIEAWDQTSMPRIRVAVNVSARWFGHPAFVEAVSRTLLAKALPADRLLLEITESAMLQMGDETQRTMRALHALGIEVAIDDFGTGYSSMAYLKLPAVAYLKIDRTFITGLPGSANDAAIAEAMLAMSKSLGLKTIAEGIETEAQHEFLLRAGCMEGQGYLYSYPLEAIEIERMLGANAPHTSAKLTVVPPRRQ